MSKPPSVIPWSYSALTAFETCQRRFYLTRIAKVVTEKQSEATLHGNAVHKALEQYVGGEAPLPDKYEVYRPMADKLKATPGKKLLEYKFALTRNLTPTTYFAPDAWCRGVIDYALVKTKTAVVADYKTGKRKLDGDQLRLFGGAALSLWPYVERVRTGYLWLQTGVIDQDTFTQEDRQPIFQEFAGRVYRMETALKADTWPPTPSGLCKDWCPVGRTNCEYCGS